MVLEIWRLTLPLSGVSRNARRRSALLSASTAARMPFGSKMSGTRNVLKSDRVVKARPAEHCQYLYSGTSKASKLGTSLQRLIQRVDSKNAERNGRRNHENDGVVERLKHVSS